MTRTLRRILCFAAAVVLLQGLALLFVTPSGLEKVFAVPLRFRAEKFRPDTNTYAVYYDARMDVGEADLIVLGMDFSVAESYDVLGHFTRFVKQNNDISAVLLPLTQTQNTLAASMLRQTREEGFSKRAETLRDATGLSGDCCDYIGEIFYVNSTMAEQKSFGVLSYLDPEELSLEERIAAAFDKTPRTALCAVDLGELDGGFPDRLREAMPGKKILYTEIYYAAEPEREGERGQLNFPLTGQDPGCYFLVNRRLGGFYAYYRFVTGLFGREREDPVDARFPDYFFVIANGTPADSPKIAEGGGDGLGLFGEGKECAA